jgi:hypothetical protein
MVIYSKNIVEGRNKALLVEDNKHERVSKQLKKWTEPSPIYMIMPQVFVAFIRNSPRLRGAPQLVQRLLD